MKPPITPPAKVPKNWKVEKKPMDEPRELIGTILDVDDGNDASITLNAPIKITKEKIV